MNRVPGLFLVAALALGASGCVTINKYNHLKDRVDEIEREKVSLSGRMAKEEERLENLYLRFKEEQDTRLRLTADRGASLEDLRDLLQRINGKIEELAYQSESHRQQLQAIVDIIDEKLGVSVAPTATALPMGEEALLAMGRQRLSQGNPREARSALRAQLERYEKGELADEARLLLGESYMQENKLDLAIRELQTLHDMHPKSELVPVALWRIADALVAQKQCDKAVAVLKYLRETRKKSEEARKAPERIKALEKTCE